MNKVPEWNRQALLESPLFVPLHPILAELENGGFPTLHDCNALLVMCQPHVTVQSGSPLHFVAQEAGKLSFEKQYEPRCYLRGEVQMRANNWHDLLNALVWLTFPRSKAAINARHYHALTSGTDLPTNAGRGAVRDVNTLLDESGVIVAYANVNSDVRSGANDNSGLAVLLRNFKWKELFWQRREQVRASMGFYLFGHGLYEKALQPYVGMTGQGLLLAVEPAFFSWPLVQQLAHLDSLMANYLAAPEHCRSTRDLSPVPLLGVPGWAADNDCAEYYDNTAYFRPGRRG
jgi:hypothetical protein